jgi:lipopolysaccharide/colanic/teichoic acid biosynthesis glycosyltransferase
MAARKARITHQPPENLFRRKLPVWKRALDIAGALCAMAFFAPIAACVALYIKRKSPGPILFAQERVGYLDKPFTIYKFRTMHAGSESAPHKNHVLSLIRADAESSGAKLAKLVDDKRIIPGGHFLRGAHLDEIPQLWNVLRGDMSLVGPRPLTTYEAEAYAQWHRERSNAVPGMTGMWQVGGKYDTTFREMVRFDIRYSRECSLWLDIRILWVTAILFMQHFLQRFAKSGSGEKGQVAQEM